MFCIRRNCLQPLLLAFFFACVPAVIAQQPTAEMLGKLKRGVVIITTYDDRGKPLLQGSGFFITPERVVTNQHVINHASRIRIETFGGQTVPVVSVASSDVNSDLALLQIDAPHPDTTTLQL